MILPHHICVFLGGNIILNEEYDNYQWVDLKDLNGDKYAVIPTVKKIVEYIRGYIPMLSQYSYLDL